MTEIKRGIVEGKLYLYEQPEMLSREDHFNLGITPVEAPFANTRNARAIPLTLTEFTTAQKNYPIVFTSLEQPVALAVVGMGEDDNLFLDNDNKWDPYAYLPAYLRAYPFAFAQHGEEQMAVVIDRAASMVSDKPEIPFFDGDVISENTKKLTEFAASYVGERRRTEEFCNRLVELELLSAQHVTHTPPGSDKAEVIANYVGIDGEKLSGLDKDTVHELHSTGMLAAMYGQLHSADNWTLLLRRRAEKLAG
ncbi:MAG: SapC family protein [Gammaproteobacteria bacterium]